MKEVKAEDSESIEDIVELSLLYSGSDVTWVAAIETLCDEFMAQNPNIIINTENSGEANCENELKVKEALDEFPDIFELENVDAFADAGKLGAIDAEVSNMVTNVIVINKKSYGLPIYATTNGVIYNKNIFKKYDLEIPDSYEEFIQICDTLKAEGICPLAIGGNQEENMTYWLNYFFQKDIMEEVGNEKREKREIYKCRIHTYVRRLKGTFFKRIYSGRFGKYDREPDCNQNDGKSVCNDICGTLAFYQDNRCISNVYRIG